MLDDGAGRGNAADTTTTAAAGGPVNRHAFDSRRARSETPIHRTGPHHRRDPPANPSSAHEGDPMTLRDILAPKTVVHAHCDLPCGVYDPEQARIEAESVYKIIEKMGANSEPAFTTRAIAIKEQRADLVKHHLDVLWHDYFKPEHLEKVPNLHELFWNATKQVSKVKASTDIADAKKLLDMIDEVDAAWKTTGGNEKTRVAGRPG
jgi:nickel superoxide dismutase